MQVFRARKIATLASEKPAASKSLFAPLEFIDNGVILSANGKIIAVGRNLALPPNCEIHDLGDVLLLPGLVNVHCHLQLSWLKNKTLWHNSFTNWLKSMVPQLMECMRAGFANEQNQALELACVQLAATGTACVGDIGGSLYGALPKVLGACRSNKVKATLFCEWFGFTPDNSKSPWPERSRADAEGQPELQKFCAPAGHGLYSTSAYTMQKAHSWCKRHKRPFTFHLAESPEETELLANGRGDLADFYRPNVLGESWNPPGLSPLNYALKLGILGTETIAAHGVQLKGAEINKFAQTGASLCICARSNHNLNVGQARVREFIEAGARLCLGTDGLTSVPDLDLRNEIYYLAENHDLPLGALWRMAIVNGAAALGVAAPKIAPGYAARFSVWKCQL